MSRANSPLSRIPRKWLFIACYALLLLLSNAWRTTHPYEAPLPPGARSVEVDEFDESKTSIADKPTMAPTGAKLALAVRDLPADTPEAPTVLLIHGLPGDASALEPVIAQLRGKCRLIIPDLPGFGGSRRLLRTPDGQPRADAHLLPADYSILANAHTLLDLLNRLGVKSVHTMAFGQGGGTALTLGQLAPDRVRSHTLVSAIGAQEFDLMGNGVVNLVVYTYQKGVFWLWHNGTPNFGLTDRLPVTNSYATALWDSNLGELKEITRAWRGPLLLAHGLNDWTVAPVNAQYAKELAPQAEALFVPGGHHIFIKDAATHAPKFLDFITRAEAGTAKTATHAPTLDNLPKAPSAEGAHHVVLMLIILGCTLVAEDPTCLATGLLVAAGLIDFWSGTLACLVGIFIGDLFLYLVGFVLGRTALRKAPLKWLISEYEVDRMAVRFGSTKGMAVIVTSRFIPGSRIPTFVAAGIMRLNPMKLGFLFFVAAALWTPPLVILAERVGGSIMEDFQKYHHLAGYIALGLLAGIFVVFHFIVPAFTWLGRRQLKAKFRAWSGAPDTRKPGLTELLAHLALGLRFRGLATYAAANPGLGEFGGVAGESKSALLAPFAGKPGLAPFAKIAPGAPADRLAALADFMRASGTAYPLVLKPDVAEGGVGIRIVHSDEEAARRLAALPAAVLAQPLATGREYELVWRRAPRAAAGRLLAVVEKRRVTVQGDGKHALERLIWASDAALNHAETFVRLNAGREDFVPAAGDRVTLCDLGSLEKGAQVSVRHGLADAAGANAAVNALAAGVPGVTWLRLDVRAESEEAFAAGRFTVTEIEGAGRLSSALRDPEMRPADIKLMLAKQRAAAFAAGRAMLDAEPAARRPDWIDLLACRAAARETQEPRD